MNGLKSAARGRGRVGGRKRWMTLGKVPSARKLLNSGMAPREVARNLGGPIPTPLSLGVGIESVSRRPRDGHRYWTAVSAKNHCI